MSCEETIIEDVAEHSRPVDQLVVCVVVFILTSLPSWRSLQGSIGREDEEFLVTVAPQDQVDLLALDRRRARDVVSPALAEHGV